MALPYQDLLHDVGLRMNALTGAQVASLETTYNTSPLTTTQFKSADWPFSSFRDAIIMAVGEFAWAIADTPNHPWRTVLSSATTVSIANGGVIPTTGIGTPDYVIDTADSTQLTEQPLEVVQRIAKETWRLYPLYFFKIFGKHIYHTRPLVDISVLTFDRATEIAAFGAAGVCVLPDVLEAPIVARAISNMVKSTLLDDKAAIYRDYSNQAMAAIKMGSTAVDPMPGPTPRATTA